MEKKYNIEVEWTGEYPCLCFGDWNITINGIKLENLEDSDFATKNNYCKWYLDSDYAEHSGTYKDGFNDIEWVDLIIRKDINNLKTSLLEHFNESELIDILNELYPLINEQDFRSGSCGGCL